MSWRVAKALLQLRKQVNEQFPTRSKVADGTIGDEAHASRSSDHNPWVQDAGIGIVTGMDLTHDPANGLDSEQLAERLRAARDPRLKYVISNRKIASFDREDFNWRPYAGKNAHNHHVHISVRPDRMHYDDESPWDLSSLGPAKPLEEHPTKVMLLSLGSHGPEVRELQIKLNKWLAFTGGAVQTDGEFGHSTQEAVKEFQRAHGLTSDGKVGPYTWEKFDAPT